MRDEVTKSEVLDLRFTYENYLVLPDNGKRYEISDGELFMPPAPTTLHQSILRKLEKVLYDFVAQGFSRREILKFPLLGFQMNVEKLF